jgi:hypothetical protein
MRQPHPDVSEMYFSDAGMVVILRREHMEFASALNTTRGA